MPTTAEPIPSSNHHSGNAQRSSPHAEPKSRAKKPDTPPQGLTAADAAARLEEFGPNELPRQDRTTTWALLGRQFASAFVVILLIAAVVSAILGEWIDTAAIAAIVLLNAVLGFVQEWKAERSLEALGKLLQSTATVMRSGAVQTIPSTQVVPGDRLLLETGQVVAADVTLVSVTELTVDESALTGESVPVRKAIEQPAGDETARDRAWMGTVVTGGHGVGIVTATGTRTEFGGVAEMTHAVEIETTPLNRQLGRLARRVGAVAIALAVLVAVVGWLRGWEPVETFMLSVSLAVAMVPEGLPAAVTLTLALGVQAMTRKKALLRRLQAAEALGEATVICTDKTGTLTENRMVVTELHTAGGVTNVTGSGYDPQGEFLRDGTPMAAKENGVLRRLLGAAATCNRARLQGSGDKREAIGEPTEAALFIAAMKAGIHPVGSELRSIPFTSDRKRMTVVTACDGRTAYAKGAPEVLLDRCEFVATDRDDQPLDADQRASWREHVQHLAERGVRTLALADRTLEDGFDLTGAAPDAVECGLTLLGIAAIIDPPRPEIADAIEEAREAGIQVLMLTGDAAATAGAIATQIGLPVTEPLAGSRFEELADDDATQAVRTAGVLARTTPAQKHRLVRLLQGDGKIVAMTGDGVNDAPALKAADIGVAMGIRGTDVARGAADVVLTDDNFATIVAAVGEGRRQFANIRKFVLYLLASNAGELVAIIGGLVLGWPLILLPVQILWMNLVTDGLSAIALGLEPAEPDAMQKPPRRPSDPVVGGRGLAIIAACGVYLGLATLWLFDSVRAATGSIALAQTAAFAGLVVIEKANVLNFRSLAWPLSRKGWLTNPWLLAAIASTLLLQVAAVYLPPLQVALKTVSLPLWVWGSIAMVALPVFIVPEMLKTLRTIPMIWPTGGPRR